MAAFATIARMKAGWSLVSLLCLSPACGADGSRRDGGPPEFMAAGSAGTTTSSPDVGSSMSGAPGSSLGSEGPNPSVPLDGTGGAGGAAGSPSVSPSQALPRSTPEAEGISSAGILQLVTALDGSVGEIHSLMLVRHGKVVAEGFWAPYSASDIHVMYSVSKSFNGTAVGLAAAEGLLGLDDPLLTHFPDRAPAQPDAEMQNVRVRDLLTMSTGHEADTMDTLRARADGEWTRAFLETDVQRQPGTYFVYNSGAAYVLSALVQSVTGVTVEEYLRPRLFAPLGIEAVLWGQSPEGVNMGDGGLSIRTEDLAKFGLLYLQGGLWNGERVLPEDWVREASSAQVSTGNSDNNWGYGYGYQFWQSRVGYRADGSLGQFSFILPEQDVVLAITSGTRNENGVMDAVWQNLMPAIQGTALPEDPGARQALQDKLTSLALPLVTPVLGEAPALASEVSSRRYAAGTNTQGISAVALDFSGTDAVLGIDDAAGSHTITLGSESWVRGRTGFKRRINELFDTPEQAVAARGAWTDADTFMAKLVFTETPYTLNVAFTFEAERVLVDMTYNVRWGNIAEPRIVGTLE